MRLDGVRKNPPIFEARNNVAGFLVFRPDPLRGCSAALQPLLHEDEIQPAAELEADLGHASGLGEAEFGVEAE